MTAVDDLAVEQGSAPPRRRWSTPLLAAVLVVGLACAFLIGRASAEPAEHGPGQPDAVDIGFCQDMGVHHEQAVLMASLAGSRAGPTVEALAASILTGQSQELGVLRGWLQLWGQPAQAEMPMSWMSDAPGGHSMDHMAMPPGGAGTGEVLMPGMASPEELTTLWGRTGNDFDVLFLQLMLRHHQGGLGMARYAAEHAGSPLVRQAAQLMWYQQGEETAHLKALLTTYGAAPLPL